MDEYLSEAEQLLEVVSTPKEMLVMADIKVWKYIIQHENICKQVSGTSFTVVLKMYLMVT